MNIFSQIATLMFVVLAVLFVGIAVFLFIYLVYLPYKSEKEYIESEIYRTDGTEREYWEQKRNNLYKEYIPVLGRYIKKFNRK